MGVRVLRCGESILMAVVLGMDVGMWRFVGRGFRLVGDGMDRDGVERIVDFRACGRQGIEVEAYMNGGKERGNDAKWVE